jgi:DNA-directed RNA polymerase specialized sigma24 family protein
MRTEDDAVVEKLDRILKLMALFATRGLNQRESIGILDTLGFTPKEIAELLGTTSNTVRVTLVAIRKGRKG